MTLSQNELAEINALAGVPAPKAKPVAVTAEELGEWLGLSAGRVHALARDGVLPRNEKNAATANRYGMTSFPLKAAVQAYGSHLRETGRRKATPELDSEKLRLARANADKLELANAKSRGEMIAAAEVERAWAGVLRDVRAAFLAMPSRAAGKLGHLTPHDLATLDAEVRDILMELANDD